MNPRDYTDYPHDSPGRALSEKDEIEAEARRRLRTEVREKAVEEAMARLRKEEERKASGITRDLFVVVADFGLALAPLFPVAVYSDSARAEAHETRLGYVNKVFCVPYFGEPQA